MYKQAHTEGVTLSGRIDFNMTDLWRDRYDGAEGDKSLRQKDRALINALLSMRF